MGGWAFFLIRQLGRCACSLRSLLYVLSPSFFRWLSALARQVGQFDTAVECQRAQLPPCCLRVAVPCLCRPPSLPLVLVLVRMPGPYSTSSTSTVPYCLGLLLPVCCPLCTRTGTVLVQYRYGPVRILLDFRLQYGTRTVR